MVPACPGHLDAATGVDRAVDRLSQSQALSPPSDRLVGKPEKEPARFKVDGLKMTGHLTDYQAMIAKLAVRI